MYLAISWKYSIDILDEWEFLPLRISSHHLLCHFSPCLPSLDNMRFWPWCLPRFQTRQGHMGRRDWVRGSTCSKTGLLRECQQIEQMRIDVIDLETCEPKPTKAYRYDGSYLFAYLWSTGFLQCLPLEDAFVIHLWSVDSKNGQMANPMLSQSPNLLCLINT